MIGMLMRVDLTLAQLVAQGLGLNVPAKPPALLNESIPADGNAAQYQPQRNKRVPDHSPALTMANTVKDGIKTR